MTYHSKAVDRARAETGKNRKKIAEYVEWARSASAKARTDAEQATVLRSLLNLTEGLQ